MSELPTDEEQEGCWVCISCGYVYDPAEGDPTAGILAGTRFDDLPESWRCPMCYAAKSQFDPL